MFSESKLKWALNPWVLVALMVGLAITIALFMAFAGDADARKHRHHRGGGGTAAFTGVTSKTNQEQTGSCTAAGQPSVCAPVTVTVPAGKQYNVAIWSSFVVGIPGTSSTSFVDYCSSVTGGSFGATPACNVIPNTSADRISLPPGTAESGSSFGNVGPLPAGTYTFFTFLSPNTTLEDASVFNAHTMVRVTDAALPGPPIA